MISIKCEESGCDVEAYADMPVRALSRGMYLQIKVPVGWAFRKEKLVCPKHSLSPNAEKERLCLESGRIENRLEIEKFSGNQPPRSGTNPRRSK